MKDCISNDLCCGSVCSHIRTDNANTIMTEDFNTIFESDVMSHMQNENNLISGLTCVDQAAAVIVVIKPSVNNSLC